MGDGPPIKPLDRPHAPIDPRSSRPADGIGAFHPALAAAREIYQQPIARDLEIRYIDFHQFFSAVEILARVDRTVARHELASMRHYIGVFERHLTPQDRAGHEIVAQMRDVLALYEATLSGDAKTAEAMALDLTHTGLDDGIEGLADRLFGPDRIEHALRIEAERPRREAMLRQQIGEMLQRIQQTQESNVIPGAARFGNPSDYLNPSPAIAPAPSDAADPTSSTDPIDVPEWPCPDCDLPDDAGDVNDTTD